MPKLDELVLSVVVYRVKSTCPSTEPCVTPYESVTVSDKVSLIFMDCMDYWCLFSKSKENQF